MTHLRTLAAAVTVAACLSNPTVSGATMPGRPGRIAYSRPVGDEGLHIFTRRRDGSGVRRLTKNGRQHRHPSWSPDGRRIVWNCWNRDEGSYVLDICLMNRDGSGKSRFRTADDEAHPVFSPDGREIAFVTDGPDVMGPDGTTYPEDHILIKNLKTGETRQVTKNDDISERDLSWSPDGRSIAYIGLGSDRAFDLFKVNVDTGEETLVREPESGAIQHVDWSPDGDSLVFVERMSDSSEDALFTVNPDGSDPRQVTRNARVPLGYPAWSPNGKKIVFLYGEGDAEACFFSSDATLDLSRYPGEMRCLRGEHFDLSWQPLQ